jgi:uncharacterized protein
MTYDLVLLLLLCGVGFASGIINTVAGGGSNLTLPVLMMLGLPPEIANATNRVGITLQCLVALKGFDKHKSLARPALLPILVPNLLGGAAGALLAALMPGLYLKPLLLGTILAMALLILIRPAIMAPEPGTPTLSPTENKSAWWGLFAAGVYGGFVQAGVGFILLAVLAAGLRYDLLRANALKAACALSFTAVALVIFILFGQVLWIPGLILAVGSMAGAHLAVRLAVKLPYQTLKWFLFVITLAACAGGFLY